jgi:hypothetical protein
MVCEAVVIQVTPSITDPGTLVASTLSFFYDIGNVILDLYTYMLMHDRFHLQNEKSYYVFNGKKIKFSMERLKVYVFII